MIITNEAAANFHCPRWNELPGIPLYMDQVILVLENSLSLFTEGKERIITPAMINNYVKQKLVPSPASKRYGRDQVATLMIICLLKRVLSMNEMTELLSLMTKAKPLSDAYDMVCAELERDLLIAFGTGNVPGDIFTRDEVEGACPAADAAMAALTCKLLFETLAAKPEEDELSETKVK